MPIHSDWVSMIKAMDKQYPTGKVRCYPKVGGGKICAHSKAWSVFYGKVKKQYGAKAYMKPRSRKSQESEQNSNIEGLTDELENDIYIDWLLKEHGIENDN